MNKLILFAFLFSTFSHAEIKNLSGYQVDTEVLCGGYPRINLTTAKGTCLGIVASKEDGLIRPRRIVQVPSGDFFITDMVSWANNVGLVWKLNPKTKKLTKIFTKVDHAHGLGLGPDGLVYVGTSATVFRFDPNNPKETKEIVIDDLPSGGNHPMSHFIFTFEGDLIVNVGAPSDQCLNNKKKGQYPCPESEGDDPEASLRLYKRNEKGEYPSYQVIAQGLRNSMALALSPINGQLFQGENGMDFKGEGTPLEEINLIQTGAHYGWPYCYEDGKLNPMYKRRWRHRHLPKIDCSVYQSPVATLPAHSAPLDMLFYQGEMFPEFKDKLIVSLHGYRPAGQRIVTLNLNENLLPTTSSKEEIVTNWAAKSNNNPKGAPVGMTVANDGSLWFVEDKNKTVMVMAKGKQAEVIESDNTETALSLNKKQKDEFKRLSKKIFSRQCLRCHSWFKGGPVEVVNKLERDGLIDLKSPEQSRLYLRLINSENGTQMPLGGPFLSPTESKEILSFIKGLL
jgi:glucose/arabinose dehydrogenase